MPVLAMLEAASPSPSCLVHAREDRILRDPTDLPGWGSWTEGVNREQSQAPKARDMVPTPSPKDAQCKHVGRVLMRPHLLGHAAPSGGNSGGALRLHKQGARFVR